MEHIIKDASHSSRMPLRENEAASGMVPYMHRGEAIPKRLAGTIPKSPIRLALIFFNTPWIRSFWNTDTQDPRIIPNTQYQKICRSCTSKWYQM